MRRLILLLPVLVLAGCVPLCSGTHPRYFVLGIGVFSLSTNQAVAEIAKAHVLGVCGTTGPLPSLSVGYTSSTTISVKTNSNVLISVSKGKVEIP